MEKLLDRQQQRLGPGTYASLLEKQRSRRVDPDPEYGRVIVRDYPGAEGAYGAMALLHMLFAYMHFLSPEQAAEIVFTNAAHPIDPLQVPLHGVLATGYAAAAHTFWTLKEGADLGLLRATPFKTLNGGLIIMGLASWTVLLPWWIHHQQGPLMPYVLGTWAFAAAIGAWALFPERPTEPPVAL